MPTPQISIKSTNYDGKIIVVVVIFIKTIIIARPVIQPFETVVCLYSSTQTIDTDVKYI